MAPPESRSNEPKSWKAGQAAARAARVIVADQLATAVLQSESTGGRAQFGRRVKELLEAEKVSGAEPELLRAAIMEVSIAAALWAVARDLRQHR